MFVIRLANGSNISASDLLDEWQKVFCRQRNFIHNTDQNGNECIICQVDKIAQSPVKEVKKSAEEQEKVAGRLKKELSKRRMSSMSDLEIRKQLFTDNNQNDHMKGNYSLAPVYLNS